MRQHLRRWLNDAALMRLGGTFEGVIANVLEEIVRNPYTAQRELQPVIVFDDGHRLIPNLTMRRALIEMFGPESNDWIGRRITVLRRRVESVNRETGERKERWQKSVYCEDRHARAPIRGRTNSSGQAVQRSEYDDSDEALTPDEIFEQEQTEKKT